LADIPPDTLDVYSSLSPISCYKCDEGSRNWLEEGMDLLKRATEEQYRTKEMETQIEITRRENTVIRQEIADTVMERYFLKEKFVEKDEEEFGRRLESAKKETIREEAVRWKEFEDQRIQDTAHRKELLRLAREQYNHGKVQSHGVPYWGIFIAGTAVAGAVIAIMKGYHYI
jgi:hypothetical protein